MPVFVKVDLLKPHRHGGRDYAAGCALSLPEAKAEWLMSIGTARAAAPQAEASAHATAPAAKPTKSKE